MRFNTEDLLTLRDGEPIDSDRRARALADPEQAGEIARLEHVQLALRALPELAPPEGVWERIAAELDAPSSSRERAAARDRRAPTRAAAAAVAAVGLVALAASIVGQRADGPISPSTPDTRAAREARDAHEREAATFEAWRVLDDRSGSAALAQSGTATPSAAMPGAASMANAGTRPNAGTISSTDTMSSTDTSTSTLPSTSEAPIVMVETGRWAPPSRMAAESARLERLLARQIRFQPDVMSAGTAGTIAGLEDTLAALDEQLTFAAAGGLDPTERETLWRERVNVMRALLQVRYAQAQRTGL